MPLASSATAKSGSRYLNTRKLTSTWNLVLLKDQRKSYGKIQASSTSNQIDRRFTHSFSKSMIQTVSITCRQRAIDLMSSSLPYSTGDLRCLKLTLIWVPFSKQSNKRLELRANLSITKVCKIIWALMAISFKSKARNKNEMALSMSLHRLMTICRTLYQSWKTRIAPEMAWSHQIC